MNINEHIIASYIEQYFRMYLKSGGLISIGVENDAYVINGEVKINIYPFWEKANVSSVPGRIVIFSTKTGILRH